MTGWPAIVIPAKEGVAKALFSVTSAKAEVLRISAIVNREIGAS
jgi:hypothetical protein